MLKLLIFDISCGQEKNNLSNITLVLGKFLTLGAYCFVFGTPFKQKTKTNKQKQKREGEGGESANEI